jgi:hypothetical protein
MSLGAEIPDGGGAPESDDAPGAAIAMLGALMTATGAILLLRAGFLRGLLRK